MKAFFILDQPLWCHHCSVSYTSTYYVNIIVIVNAVSYYQVPNSNTNSKQIYHFECKNKSAYKSKKLKELGLRTTSQDVSLYIIVILNR